MDEVIELLTDKNQFLEKFYSLNETELISFSEGNFDNLERFYNSREAILEMVSKIDSLIEDTQGGEENISDGLKKKML